MEYVDALNNGIIFGIALVLFVPMLVERLKIWLPGFTDKVGPKNLALAVGTLLGSGYLFVVFPVLDPVAEIGGILLRIASAFVWSFTGPWFYDLLQNAAAEGVEDHIEEVEERLVMGGEIPEDQIIR